MALTSALMHKDNKDSLVAALDALPKTPYFCPHCGARVHRRSYGVDKASFACYKREVHTSPICLALVGHVDRSAFKTNTKNLFDKILSSAPPKKRRSIGDHATSSSGAVKPKPPTTPMEKALTSLAHFSELDRSGTLEQNSILQDEVLFGDIILHPDWDISLPPDGENLGKRIAKATAQDYNDEDATISFSIGGLVLIIAFYQKRVAYVKQGNLVFTKSISDYGAYITPPSTPFVWIAGDWMATELPKTFQSDYFGTAQIFIPKYSICTSRKG